MTHHRSSFAAQLWQWARGREDFTSREAVNATGINQNNVCCYLRIWFQAKALALVSPNGGRRGGRVYKVIAEERPSVFVSPRKRDP